MLLIGAMVAGVYTWPSQAQIILVNQWSFDGNLNDSSGNGNNGTLAGSGSFYTNGPFSGHQGIYLTAANLISTTTAVGLPTAGNADWSMNLWLYLTNTPISLAYMAGFGATATAAGVPPNGTARGLLAYGAPSNLGIYLWGKGADLASGAPYPLNQWVMVTITHNGSANTTSFYTNGVRIMTGAETALVTVPSPQNRYIQVGYPGSLYTYAAGGFKGIIAEFTIWSGVLGTNDIAGLYASDSVPLVAPSIVTAPNPVTQYAGEYASLSVTAGNIGPFAYQWQRSGTNLLGQTNATIGLGPLAATNAGSYQVIVTNLYGSVTSSPPTLVTVLPVTNIITALAAYWTFYEPNGLVVNDVSGNGNNGQMFGFAGDGSERIPGIVGQALHFRGGPSPGDYIQITNCNIRPPTTMTIAGWVNVDTSVNYAGSSATYATLVKNWPNIAAYQQVHFGLNGTSGEDSCFVETPTLSQIGPVTETTALPKGQWIHVVFTADGTNMNVYRNGVMSATPVPYGGTLNTNIFLTNGIANTMGIGVKLQTNGLPFPTSSPGWWQGSMDDLAIWARALTPAEILSIYLAGEVGQPMTNAGAYANIVFPLITSQPQPVTRYQGEYAAQFSVIAEGAGAIHYQWTTNGVAVAGATNSVLTLPGPFTTAGATTVQVTLTNAGTTNIVTSTPVALTVLSTANITTALAAYWNFAEPNGLGVNDVSGNGNDGQMFGFAGDGSERVPGIIGQALHFRGQSFGDYIQIPNCNILPPSTMTISGWVYVDVDSTWGTIVKNWPNNAAYNQVHFGLDGYLGEDSCFVNTPTGTQIGPVIEATVMPKGQWVHVAFTADGTNLNVYRDGALNATPVPYGGALSTNVIRDASGFANTTGIGVKLGTDGLPYTSNAPGWWQGSMDDLAIWTRALTPMEILSIYLAGEAGQPWTNAGAYANAVFPIITYQPQPVTKYQGEYTAQFSVVAAGSGAVYYQWATNGVPVTGATSNVFTLPGPFTTAGAMPVQVTVTDAGTTNIVLSTAVALTVLPVTSITDGLSAHWAFDETNGYTAFDSTTNDREGALISYYNDPMQWVSGQVGGALSFDGGSQFLWVTNYVEPTNNTLTISAWVFATTENSLASIIDSYGQNPISPIGQFRFGLANNELTGGVISQGQLYTSATDGTAFPINTWQHVALVADGASVRLYRNGIQVSSNTYPGTILSFSGLTTGVTNLMIGARIADDGYDLNTTPGYWGGMIDDLGMWSRGLTPGEIAEIYVAGAGGQPLNQAVEPVGGVVAPYYPAQAPASLTLQAGGSGSFAPFFIGTPLSYQWWSNNVVVPGATNRSLVLSDVPLAWNSNQYFVVATNIGGAATSAVCTLTVLAPTSPYVTVVMGDKPIAFYRLDEGPDNGMGNTGATAYDTVGAHNGFYNNVILQVPGYSSYDSDNVAAAFGQYPANPTLYNCFVGGINGVDFSTPAGTSTNFSVEAWVNFATYNYGDFVSKGGLGTSGGNQFALDDSGGFRFYCFNAAGTVAYVAAYAVDRSQNTWYHVVGVLNEANNAEYLYVNGVLVATTSLPAGSGVFSTALPLTIGSGWYQNGTYAWQVVGSIANVALYNYALSATQVQDHYLVANGSPALVEVPTNTTIYQGETATFYSSAVGTAPLTYQWLLNGAPLTDGPSPSGTGAIISGATNANLSIAGVTVADSGETYSVVVTNSVGATPAAAATLTVVARNVVLAAKASGTNLVVAWPSLGSSGYQLQSNTNLVNANGWVNVTNSVSVGNGQDQVTVPLSAKAMFFRLQWQ